MRALPIETVRYSDTARQVAVSTREDGVKVSTTQMSPDPASGRVHWETATIDRGCKGCAVEGWCDRCDDRIISSYTRGAALVAHETAVDRYLLEGRNEERLWPIVAAAALCIVVLLLLATLIA